MDKNDITKTWLVNCIKTFNHPEIIINKTEDLQFLQHVQHFIDKAPQRRNRDGVHLKPNAIQQYKATQMHLTNYIQGTDKVDVEFQEINETFYNGFIEYLQNLNFAQNTVGKHIRIMKVMLNDAPLKYRGESDYSKFKVFNNTADSIYLNEDELNKLWAVDLSKTPTTELARDWFLIMCWTACRYSDIFEFLDIDKETKIIEFSHEKTGNKVAIPIHPVVKEVLEKYNWEMPAPLSNQNINPHIQDAVEAAGINERVRVSKTLGGKKVKQYYKKFELVGTHTGRRSFCTNMYKMGIPTYQIMSISGHKSEKNFLKYIKVTNKEHANKMLEDWENYYNPKTENDETSPEFKLLNTKYQELKVNYEALRSVYKIKVQQNRALEAEINFLKAEKSKIN